MTPDGEQLGTHRSHSGGHTAVFTVQNTGDEEDLILLSCQVDAPVICLSLSERAVRLQPDASAQVEVTYGVGAAGTGTLRLVGASELNMARDEGYYRVPVQDPSIAVTPDGEEVRALPWRWTTEVFRLEHLGSGTVSYELDVSCSGAAYACTASSSDLTFEGRETKEVEVRFFMYGMGRSGSIELAAIPTTYSWLLGDTGSVQVSPGRLGTPEVDVASVNPGKTVARDLCLSFPAGSAAAYECGDLRVAHPLPGVRTLSKSQAPALIYNSQHAHPYPLVSAEVTLPTGVVRPDTMEAVLTVEGVERARGTWDGDDWRSERPSRISLGFDGLNDPTGAYEYTMEVAAIYGSQRYSSTAAGTLIIVNRSESPFGAGWWLAGLEQLVFGEEHVLWIGGDGSARVYEEAVATGVLAAPPVDRPDTLTTPQGSGERFTRYLLHGRQVKFDLAGRHVATIDRLGHETSFRYDRAGRLQSITLPPEGSGLTYDFQYDAEGKLRAVMAPRPDGRRRPNNAMRTLEEPEPDPDEHATSVSILDGRVRRILDPDDRAVYFGYSPSFAHRMQSHTDGRGTTTSFGYDAGSTLRSATIDMRSAPDIIMGYRAVESLGLPSSDHPGAVPEGNAYTLLDEPRTGVGDSTLYWTDRFGAATRVRDPLGYETITERGDPRWPALPTRIEHPNGKVVGITYDDRGNILTMTDSSTYRSASRKVSGPAGAESAKGPRVESPLYELFSYPREVGANPKAAPVAAGTRVYATTRYEWDRVWDFATVVVPPEGDSTVSAYDPDTGNRLWVQDARGPSTRVEYGYNALGLSVSVDGPSDAPPLVTRYDALGNVSQTVTPSGAVATHHRDAIGRDTLILTPIDADGQFFKRRRILYDAMGRDTLVQVIALRRPGAKTETDTLTIRKEYDAEGNLVRHERTIAPDLTEIGTVVNEWEYDPANRRIASIDPDGARDSTVYDAAGNPIERHTRRGHAVTMEYDAAGQLIERYVPSVRYDEWLAVTPRGERMADFSLPRYGDGLTVPADRATYTYDAQGNVLTADNRYAKIRRTYHENGTLATDELRIREYPPGGGFSRHVYRIGYDYDLNGRVVGIQHPENIAPLVDGARKDTVQYGYDETGRLSRIVDLLGNVFEYEYDASGRLKHVDQPGDVHADLTYDDDGRLLTRRIETHEGASGFKNGIIHDDLFTYDGRDKIVHAEAHDGGSSQSYAGLGPLYYTENDRLGQSFWNERFTIDGLGNRRFMSKNPREGSSFSTHRSLEYTSGSGRLQLVRHRYSALSEQLQFKAEYTYDESGNEQHYTRFPCPADDPCYGNIYAVLWHARKAYYDAANRLVAVDKHVCAWILAENVCAFPTVPFYERNVYEEHRYDALGRRVLTRARYDDDCYFCESYIQRTVWAGDQVLYEMRYPGGDDVSEAGLERDTGPAYTEYRSYGRVAYTHGDAIDKPVSIVRMDYSADWPEPVAVFPHADWSGVHDVGHFDDGSGLRCVDALDEDTCVNVDWPGARQGRFLELPTSHIFPPKSWFGNVITRHRDASGWMYRRNRYYDPGTGRFTQEDPIGLKGGVDVYRYAGGDPVNFTDPFGLDDIPIYYAPPIVVTAPRWDPFWDASQGAPPDATGVAIQPPPPPRSQIDLFPPSFWHGLGLSDPDRKRGHVLRNGDHFRPMTKGEARIHRILLNRYIEQILEPSVIVNDPRLPTSMRIQNYLENALRVLEGAAGASVQGPGSAAIAGGSGTPVLQGASRSEIEATLDYLKSIENQ